MEPKGNNYDCFTHYAGIIAEKNKKDKCTASFLEAFWDKVTNSYLLKIDENKGKTNLEKPRQYIDDINKHTLKKHKFLIDQAKEAVKEFNE